ncbi:MAG: trigger factor [Nitrospirota bacterium]
MLLDVEELSPVKKKLKIEIPIDIIESEIEGAYRQLNKKAKIPGFRPGRIPRVLLERQYKDDVEHEVIEKLLPQYYFDAVKDSGIIPVQNPRIEGDIRIEKGQPITFTATVEIKPSIEVSNYDGIEIEGKEVTISDDDVEKAMANLRESHAYLEKIAEDHMIENGDFVLIELEGSLEGKPVEVLKARDYLLEIGSNTFIPGIEEKLISHSAGETIDVKTTFPENHPHAELKGKEVDLNIKLKEIKKKVLPPLDNEFAKDLGSETLDSLKEQLKNELTERIKKQIERGYKEKIIQRLIDSHPFEVPPSMVDSEIYEMIIENNRHLLQKEGGADDFVREEIEKLRNEYTPLAIRSVKGALILEAISKKENITVGIEEVDAEIERISRETGHHPDTIRRTYISRYGNLEGLRETILQRKTLDILLSKTVIKIVDRSPLAVDSEQ